MPIIGINNVTTVTIDNITMIANSSTPQEFLVKVSIIVYGGILWIVVLYVLWALLWKIAQSVDDAPFVNLMRTGAIMTIVALLFRFITAEVYSATYPMITDMFFWTFPLITAVTAFMIWLSRRD